jgi:trans-aconitate methyltransferase
VDLRERDQHAQRHPWEVARARHFRRLIAAALAAPPTTVVDVGAGDGWFAEQLRNDLAPGASIICVDRNYTATDLARHLPAGIVRRTTMPDEPAQLVLALDVLEHIDDDRTFVTRQLAPLVSPAGRLVVSVPAHQRLFTSHDQALGHFRRHDAASLRALLEPRFEVLSEGSLFTTLLAPRAATALIQRVRPRRGPVHVDSVWRHGELLSSGITTLLDADAAVGRMLAGRPHRPPGLSVWAVCRPRADR